MSFLNHEYFTMRNFEVKFMQSMETATFRVVSHGQWKPNLCASPHCICATLKMSEPDMKSLEPGHLVKSSTRNIVRENVGLQTVVIRFIYLIN